MATIKQGYKKYLEEHSKIKVEYLKKYLDIYLTVLMHSPYTKVINIYDLFCGIGIYEDDKSKGSPIVIIEVIKEKQKLYGNNKLDSIKLLINDGIKEQVNVAKEYIENNYNDVCDLEVYNLDAKDIFKLVIEDIKKSVKEQNNFIFIDPHGYKEIYKKDILSIMEAGKNEILLFLPVHHMHRFVNPAKEDFENPSYKPLKRFMDEFSLNYNTSSIEEYVYFIKRAFSYDGAYYSTSFILESHTKNKYALFFITKNLKGLEESVKIKWEFDTICGKSNQKKKDLGLWNEHYEKEDRKNCFKHLEDILNAFLIEEKTNKELYEFALNNEFLPKHLIDILKRYIKENKVKFDRNLRKNSFYINYENFKKNEIKYKVKIIE